MSVLSTVSIYLTYSQRVSTHNKDNNNNSIIFFPQHIFVYVNLFIFVYLPLHITNSRVIKDNNKGNKDNMYVWVHLFSSIYPLSMTLFNSIYLSLSSSVYY